MKSYDLPDGVIKVSYCNEELSIGTLKLDPGKELDRHNRPVDEELLQIKGKGGLKIFEEEKERQRQKRRHESMTLKTFLGLVESYTEKFLEEGMTKEQIEYLTRDKIKVTARMKQDQ